MLKAELEAQFGLTIRNLWLFSEMQALWLAVQDIAAGLGGVDWFREAFSGVTVWRFRRPDRFGAEVSHPSGSFVYVYDGTFDKGQDKARFVLIHEFGHVMDARNMLSASGGLESATAGQTQGLGCGNAVVEVLARGWCDYEPNGPTVSGYSRQNRREDWADSFAAYIFNGDWQQLELARVHTANGNDPVTQASANLAVERMSYVQQYIYEWKKSRGGR